MAAASTRRTFLRNSALGGALAGVGDLSFLAGVPAASAADVKPDPNSVRFSADIEPLVRLLEDTPRGELLEKVAERIRGGATYRQVLSALFLAGIRNVQPRPAVGFKFHAVLVVNSAHLAATNSPDEHRWLPIFWALDYFKDSQARDEREGNWTMPAVSESALPKADKAKAMFVAAMDDWDETKADVAAAALARTASMNDLFEIFCRYGARDFRSIGHKAIYVANSWRTLACIGRENVEPIVRSLAYALLNHEGGGNPAKNSFEADRPWRDNLGRAAKIRADWQTGRDDPQATRDLLSTLYAGSNDDVCDQVVEVINSGVSAQAVWDALLLEGGELLMRQPGIVGLHTLTTTNALRYAYETSANDETRKLMLLQNAAFLPMFRDAMTGRGKVAATKILDLEPAAAAQASKSDQPPAEIFAAIGRDPMSAARQTLAYAQGRDDVTPFIDAARVLVFLKGRDTHDYKFSSAVLEDHEHLSPEWRGRFLAASVFNLRGTGGADNPLVERTRAALAG